MSYEDYEKYVERLQDEASSLLEAAANLSNTHFRSDVSDDPNVVVGIAQVMALVALRHSVTDVASELSSIENAINGK